MPELGMQARRKWAAVVGYSWAPRWRGSKSIARLVPEGGVELLQVAVRVAEVILQVRVRAHNPATFSAAFEY